MAYVEVFDKDFFDMSMDFDYPSSLPLQKKTSFLKRITKIIKDIKTFICKHLIAFLLIYTIIMIIYVCIVASFSNSYRLFPLDKGFCIIR